jgi:hypothetical protein
MKLYATTTSERASKGQGGNKDILVVITAEITGERQEIFSVSVVNTEKGFYAMDVKMPDGQLIHHKISKGDVLKGERQKGD